MLRSTAVKYFFAGGGRAYSLRWTQKRVGRFGPLQSCRQQTWLLYVARAARFRTPGRVLVGASGGELGIRGFVAAFDTETGKEIWRTYTIPAPGEPGSETWPKGDQWKKRRRIRVGFRQLRSRQQTWPSWGVGNGGPWRMGDQRPGDNLYTASTIALDVATGKIKGYHQYNPNESWDWDEVSPPILVDFMRNGRLVKGLIDVARDGYLWFSGTNRRNN